MKRLAGAGWVAWFAWLGWMCLATGCGDFSRTAGGTSDTDNALAFSGIVEGKDKAPAPGVAVRMRRVEYLSPFPALGKVGRAKLDTLTDGSGRFHIDSVDTGRYFIEANSGDSLATLFQARSEGQKGTVSLGARPLEKVATVSGVVLFRAGTFRANVQCYGLERRVPVDTLTGEFSLALPAGTFRLRILDPEKPSTARSIEVTVTAGQVLRLDTLSLGDSAAVYLAWRHSAEIGIDASASGGGIKSNLFGFPLLVRLDSAGFDFGAAAANGADIRFSKADGITPLSFAIERWDAVAKRAEIWVKVDTILGDVRNRGIQMYWGKTGASGAGDGEAVFAPAEGWRAVWHLGEPASNAPGTYRDATANGNHGMGVVLGDTSSAEGAVGRGLRLNGRDQFVRIPDAPTLHLGRGDFTLSAWFRADTLIGKHQVMSKRDSAHNYEVQVETPGRAVGYPGDPKAGPNGFVGPLPVSQDAWHHVALTREGSRCVIYLDGVLDTANTTPATETDSPADLLLGMDGDDQKEFWNGVLDEVGIADRARTADWIKLSHRNQAPGSRMLEWRRFP